MSDAAITAALVEALQAEIRSLRSEILSKDAQNAALTAALTQLTAVIEKLSTRVDAPPNTALTHPLTWNELWKAYEDDGEAKKNAAWNTAEGRWRKHLGPHFGAERVMTTILSSIKGYRRKRAEEFTIRKKLTAPATRNREIELLRSVAAWGRRQNPPLIPADPFDSLSRDDLFEPEENIRLNVVEDDPQATMSIEDLLRYGNELDCALVLMAHSSGMRRGELAIGECDWLDLRPDRNGKPLRIVQIPPGVSKGRRGKKLGRQTFISEAALGAYLRYRKTLPFPLQRRGRFWFMNTTEKFYGEHLHPDTLTQRFKELQERAGLSGPSGPPWLHDLRRSFITLARRRGEDTSNIMEASGHLTAQAFNRYDIHARKDAIAVRDRVDQARAAELAALLEQRRALYEASTGVDSGEDRRGPHHAPMTTEAKRPHRIQGAPSTGSTKGKAKI